ncbi:MAG: hypothetical protein D6744_18795 [Planctomycetota bacterium]|nr:MAG: hypothetical protein D6744_18795 [Planctomycetota bacterium]
MCTELPAFAQNASPRFEVVGLRIVAAPPKDHDDLRAFNQTPGTTIALLLRQPAGGLIAIETDDSRLEAFRDDTGGDLLTGDDSYFGPFGSFPDVSDDQTLALFELSGPGMPAANAKTVTAKGVLKVKQATKSAKARTENVVLAPETKFEVGDYAFVITEVGESEWSDAKLSLTLKTKQDINAVRAMRFFDADGAEIKADVEGSSSMRFGSNVTFEVSYGLAKKVANATIEIDVWQDLKTIDLPFEVSAGVGLSK